MSVFNLGQNQSFSPLRHGDVSTVTAATEFVEIVRTWADHQPCPPTIAAQLLLDGAALRLNHCMYYNNHGSEDNWHFNRIETALFDR
jgi:hypothetical protein